MKRLKIILAVIIILKLASCTYNGTEATVTCSTVDVSFTEDVMPVVTTSCATNTSCHASGSSRGPGALTTYAQVYASRSSIKSAVSSGSMPQGSTLSSTEKNYILCWIENGAQNN